MQTHRAVVSFLAVSLFSVVVVAACACSKPAEKPPPTAEEVAAALARSPAFVASVAAAARVPPEVGGDARVTALTACLGKIAVYTSVRANTWGLQQMSACARAAASGGMASPSAAPATSGGSGIAPDTE